MKVGYAIGLSCNIKPEDNFAHLKKEYMMKPIRWLVSLISRKVINDCDGRITELGNEYPNTKYLSVKSGFIA
jgi:hypothetical protein